MSSKNLLLELRAFLADDKIRRNILSVRNSLGSSGSVDEAAFAVAPSGSSVRSIVSSNTSTLLISDQPVNVTVTNALGSLVFNASTVLVLSSNVTGLTIANPSTTLAANCIVIQS